MCVCACVTYLCHLQFARLFRLLGVGVVVRLDNDQVAAVLVDGELARRVFQRIRHLDNGADDAGRQVN